MNEFMLYVRNEKNAKKTLSADEYRAYIKECEVYIAFLKAEDKFISMHPNVTEGLLIKKSKEGWIEENIAEDKEIQVGYYHILAEDFADAVRIAKDNPEFKYIPSASIEVRPIKKDTDTGYEK